MGKALLPWGEESARASRQSSSTAQGKSLCPYRALGPRQHDHHDTVDWVLCILQSRTISVVAREPERLGLVWEATQSRLSPSLRSSFQDSLRVLGDGAQERGPPVVPEALPKPDDHKLLVRDHVDELPQIASRQEPAAVRLGNIHHQKYW